MQSPRQIGEDGCCCGFTDILNILEDGQPDGQIGEDGSVIVRQN